MEEVDLVRAAFVKVKFAVLVLIMDSLCRSDGSMLLFAVQKLRIFSSCLKLTCELIARKENSQGK